MNKADEFLYFRDILPLSFHAAPRTMQNGQFNFGTGKKPDFQ